MKKTERYCPFCGRKLSYDDQCKNVYCHNCDRYFLIDENGEILINDSISKVRIDDEDSFVEDPLAKQGKSKKIIKIILAIIFLPITLLIGPFYLTWYMFKKDYKSTKKKKVVLVTLSWIVWLMMLAACTIPGINRKIYLANEYKEVDVGDVLDLSYVIEPESNQDVEIAISDDSILEKEDGFYYKAIKEGEVTVALISNKKEYSSYNIKVNEVLMKNISFTNKNLQIALEDSLEPEINYEPANVTYPKWNFISDDEEILEVNDNKIVAKGEGVTTLHVISSNGLEDEIEVSVVPVIAESISIQGKISLKIGESEKYTVSYNPSNVTYKEATLTIDNNDIAEIDKEGNLIAKKDGKVTITANETSNNKEAKKIVTINPIYASKITLSAPYDSLYVGDSMNVSVSYSPENVTYKKVEYTSSDENIVSVNENGYVYAIAEGTAKITAKTENGIKDTITVKVISNAIASTSQANVSSPVDTYSNTNSGSSDQTMVWISSSGKKYHRSSGCSNMKNPWQVSLEQAKSMGKEACKKCY